MRRRNIEDVVSTRREGTSGPLRGVSNCPSHSQSSGAIHVGIISDCHVWASCGEDKNRDRIVCHIGNQAGPRDHAGRYAMPGSRKSDSRSTSLLPVGDAREHPEVKTSEGQNRAARRPTPEDAATFATSRLGTPSTVAVVQYRAWLGHLLHSGQLPAPHGHYELAEPAILRIPRQRLGI